MERRMYKLEYLDRRQRGPYRRVRSFAMDCLIYKQRLHAFWRYWSKPSP